MKHGDRQAEIAGAGPAGLTAAVALAKKGWRVRVHEKSDDLRMFGAGIWLWENGLRVLEELGVLERTMARASEVSAWEIRDHHNRLVSRRECPPWDRLIVPPRADMYNALLEVARDLGVEIVTESRVISADPSGELLTEDGRVFRADLIVGADGVYSNVRTSIGLTKSFKESEYGSHRVLIPKDPEETSDVVVQYMSNGRSGFLYNPCTDREIYLAFGCSAQEAAARRVPIDHETWIAKFPSLESVIRRIGPGSRWDRHVHVTCHAWSKGKVALVGDAAHGMAPWLGQAANTAFGNALTLADFVTRVADVESALSEWEATMRPVTDHTQRWNAMLGGVFRLWPMRMAELKALTVKGFLSLPGIDNKLYRAQRKNPLFELTGDVGTS